MWGASSYRFQQDLEVLIHWLGVGTESSAGCSCGGEPGTAGEDGRE